MAPDSRLPVRPRPAGPRLVAPPGAGRVPPPGVGTGVRCGEPFVPGNGVRPERGPPSRPSRLTHVRVEPGAKPFVDDLLLGRGFVRSRAAPSLRSIESQPSTQGFVRARARACVRAYAREVRRPRQRRPRSAARRRGRAVLQRIERGPPDLAENLQPKPELVPRRADGVRMRC